jgi:cellulose synthase/poly-beta-1,6-N-acetylglucosamine synthase-like glycosyltransferase
MEWESLSTAAFILTLAGLLPVLYSYLLFPLILIVLKSFQKKMSETLPSGETELPFLTILMAARNEEKVLVQKLQSIFHTDYPQSRIRILVGSDQSTDQTNLILEKWASHYPKQIIPFYFNERTGKTGILNQLCAYWRKHFATEGGYWIFTDANVFFSSTLLSALAAAMKNREVGVAGARILNPKVSEKGIATSEKFYLNWDNMIKQAESDLWGYMLAPPGGCFAYRPEIFDPIPPQCLADDFYLGMLALEKGRKAVFVSHATCTEDVSHDPSVEFKRKERIARGNIQNLQRFGYMLWRRPLALAFCFWSHKLLRWLSPIFLLILFSGTMIGLASHGSESAAGFVCILIASFYALLFIPGLPAWVRAPGYFLHMNLALLSGFIKYLKGSRESFWEPTTRTT